MYRLTIVLVAIIGLSLVSVTLAADKNLTLDDYLYAKRLFDEGYFDLAADQLERVLQNHPDFPNADEAHYLLADAYYKNDMLKKARATYLRLAIVFPESPLAAESMYNVASVLEVMEKPKEAAHAFGRVYSFYPQSVFALKGLGHALRIYETIQDTSKAETVSELILENFSTSTIADQVRLHKALWLLARGNTVKAKSLLIRLSDQTFIDSLSARALLELGRIYLSELRWEKAVTTWSRAKIKDRHSMASFQAMLETANLFIYQGLTVEAIKLLTGQLDKSTDSTKTALTYTTIGDAYYRQGDYQNALRNYQLVAHNDQEAKLKSAWTSEMLGADKLALSIYLDIANNSLHPAIEVKVRIATIAQKMGDSELAKRYWYQVISDSSKVDTLGRYYWQFSQLLGKRSDELRLLDSLSLIIKERISESPFTDDISFWTALAYHQNEQFEEAIHNYQELIDNYPASPFREAATNSITFIRQTKIRSPLLVEKMAELSSTNQASKDPVKWSIAWGDFYLDDFKNPVKAIDHYDQVIQDILGSTEQRAYCIYKTGIAYLGLCQTAQFENDYVAVEMYCDSAHARLIDLEKLTPDSDQMVSLSNEIMYNDYILADKNISLLSAVYYSTAQLISKIGLEEFQPRIYIKYFQSAYAIEAIDTRNHYYWLDQSQIAARYATSDTEMAEIKYLQLRIISMFDSSQSAVDSAKKILQKWQDTAGAANTVEWILGNPNVTPVQKLAYLQFYKQNYPYRVDPKLFAWYAAKAYDSLGMHFESIVWNKQQKDLSRWGTPDINILNMPDAITHYRRGIANLEEKDYIKCFYEFRSYLNLEPEGDFAANVFLYFAKINMLAENYTATISFLDTLSIQFPYSSQNEVGELLRPRAEMAAGNYSKAFELFLAQNTIQSDPDSSFEYDRLSIVCKYRLNDLENARLMAKALYKKYEKRNDLESVKAQFYLEKGRSQQRSGNFLAARKNYKIIADKYSLTEWMDDAQFEFALSLLKEKNWQAGTAHLATFIENYPASDYIPLSILTLGVTRLNEENYSEALKYLKNAWLDTTSELIRLRAFNHLITAYKDLHFWDAAIQISREYLEEYSEANDAFIRKMDIGQFYIQIGEYEEAIRHYRPMLDYADAESEAEIQFYIGESFQKAGDYQTAILEYMKVRILGRKTKLDWGITALYQSGNCYELLGEIKGATHLYQRIIKYTGATSNYGRTAQKRLDGLKMNTLER